jgi:hypothetical protein
MLLIPHPVSADFAFLPLFIDGSTDMPDEAVTISVGERVYHLYTEANGKFYCPVCGHVGDDIKVECCGITTVTDFIDPYDTCILYIHLYRNVIVPDSIIKWISVEEAREWFSFQRLLRKLFDIGY